MFRGAASVAPLLSTVLLNRSIWAAAGSRSAGLYQTIHPREPDALESKEVPVPSSKHGLKILSCRQKMTEDGNRTLESLHSSPCALDSVILLTKL